MEIQTLLITQARLGSTRLPGKVLKQINGTPLLKIHLDRLKKSQRVSEIVVATTILSSDDIIYDNALKWGYKAFRGSDQDVLDRYYKAAKEFNPQWIVRVTSDCPLLDPNLLDEVITFVQNSGADYGANILIESFPDGQDIEVFTFAALEKAWKEANKEFEREHVTPFIRNNSTFNGGSLFASVNYPCPSDFSKIRMTVDEPKDLLAIKEIIESLGVEKSWIEYTNYIIKNNLMSINGDIVRNEGYIRSVKNEKNG